jgi:hypothetical protein
LYHNPRQSADFPRGPLLTRLTRHAIIRRGAAQELAPEA